jgi:hypothetical protein
LFSVLCTWIKRPAWSSPTPPKRAVRSASPHSHRNTRAVFNAHPPPTISVPVLMYENNVEIKFIVFFFYGNVIQYLQFCCLVIESGANSVQLLKRRKKYFTRIRYWQEQTGLFFFWKMQTLGSFDAVWFKCTGFVFCTYSILLFTHFHVIYTQQERCKEKGHRTHVTLPEQYLGRGHTFWQAFVKTPPLRWCPTEDSQIPLKRCCFTLIILGHKILK